MRIILGLLGLMLSAPALAQGTAAQAAFLQSADTGNVAAMVDMLDGRIGLRGGASMPRKQFERMMGDCYLRRVSAGEGGAMLASWMCKDGEGSKMVLARVLDEGGAVSIEGLSETPLKAPMPPRTGSALEGR